MIHLARLELLSRLKGKINQLHWITLAAVAVAIVIFGCALVVSASREWGDRYFASTTPKPLLPSSKNPQGQPEPPKLIRVTLHPWGFEPASVTLSRGQCLLFVENRSGIEDIIIHLDRKRGNREHTAKNPKGKLDNVIRLNLQPGDYVLKEATHPEWTCKITVTDR
jgi:hypothetical protein